MNYTIKQFATIFNTTEHTLRYYTDIGILPCQRDSGKRRIFNEISVNWMQGIICLRNCGASIEDIKEYCQLCLAKESKENLQARYNIILKQRQEAQRRLEEAQATVDYINKKAHHYEEILAGLSLDDTNPNTWTPTQRPAAHTKHS